MWSTDEVSLTFGFGDFVVADDASVRRVGVVFRLGFGLGRVWVWVWVWVWVVVARRRSGLRAVFALRRIVELNPIGSHRRGAGVDCSPGLDFALLDLGAGAGWTVALGRVSDLDLDLARTGGDRRVAEPRSHLRKDRQGREFDAGRSVGRGGGIGLEPPHVRGVGLGLDPARTGGHRRMGDIVPKPSRLREVSQGRKFDTGRSVGRGRGIGLGPRHVRGVGGSHASRPV